MTIMLDPKIQLLKSVYSIISLRAAQWRRTQTSTDRATNIWRSARLTWTRKNDLTNRLRCFGHHKSLIQILLLFLGSRVGYVSSLLWPIFMSIVGQRPPLAIVITRGAREEVHKRNNVVCVLCKTKSHQWVNLLEQSRVCFIFLS